MFNKMLTYPADVYFVTKSWMSLWHPSQTIPELKGPVVALDVCEVAR